jgi:hypothetical protein
MHMASTLNAFAAYSESRQNRTGDMPLVPLSDTEGHRPGQVRYVRRPASPTLKGAGMPLSQAKQARPPGVPSARRCRGTPEAGSQNSTVRPDL